MPLALTFSVPCAEPPTMAVVKTVLSTSDTAASRLPVSVLSSATVSDHARGILLQLGK